MLFYTLSPPDYRHCVTILLYFLSVTVMLFFGVLVVVRTYWKTPYKARACCHKKEPLKLLRVLPLQI